MEFKDESQLPKQEPVSKLQIFLFGVLVIIISLYIGGVLLIQSLRDMPPVWP
jgi:uncharacterized protein YhhL (DUF1145 family)